MIICKICNSNLMSNGYCDEHSSSGKGYIDFKIEKLGLARCFMREILRYDGLLFGEVDKICRLIPNNASICRITGNTLIDKLPEGKELTEIIKKYIKSFEFGCILESKFDHFSK